MREVLVEALGEEWYEDYWPYVRYLVSSVRDAWSNRIRDWFLLFSVDGVIFSGSVAEFSGDWIAVAYIEYDGLIVSFDLLDGSCRVGEDVGDGVVDWMKVYDDCGVKSIMR